MVHRVAAALQSDRYCKRFSSYDHLVTMLYTVFNQCHSLREVTTGLLAWEQRLTHLGLKYYPRRSTLSDANQRRSAEVFERIYGQLIGQYGPFLSDSRRTGLQQRLYIFDSTTITLFQEVLKGAGLLSHSGKRKGGIKVHTLLKSDQDMPTMLRFSAAAQPDSLFLKQVQLPRGSILVFDRGYNHYATFNRLSAQGLTWVTRLRSRTVYKCLQQRPLCEGQQAKGMVSDEHIVMGHHHEKNSTKVLARLITYTDPESGKTLQFLTNNFKLAAATVARLYRKRWQIEVLFKRLKQNYPLQYFLGESENAIRIQIWCALIADLLLNVVRKAAAARWSFSNLASMIRLHLMTYIHLAGFLKSPEKALLRRLGKPISTDQHQLLFPP